MGELYCERCGCRILAEWDVGAVHYRLESWGAGGRHMVRRMVLVCAGCREDELEPPLTPAEAAIEAAFDRWAGLRESA